MTKLDIKDAYYSVPIKLQGRTFLKFMHKGKVHEFCALPNGPSTGPQKYTELLKLPLLVLGKQKLNVRTYIDDLLLTNKPFKDT